MKLPRWPFLRPAAVRGDMPELQDGTPYEIRQVRREDYEGDKYDKVHAWLGEVDEFLAIKFGPEDVELNRVSWLQQVGTQDEKTHVILGALLGEEVIGQADLRIFSVAGHNRMHHVGEWGLAVKKEYHNQGIGTTLLQAIEDLGHYLGLHKLAAEVVDDNERAKTLYLNKFGYEVEGRKREHFLHDTGEYLDLLVIGKFLGGEKSK